MQSRSDHERQDLKELRDEVKRLRKALVQHTPDIAMLLHRRGFRTLKLEPTNDLLIPNAQFQDDFYNNMHKYSFRLFLRDLIKHQDFFMLKEVTRYATVDVSTDYLRYAEKIGLVRMIADGYQLSKRPITSFGATLEWYVAEVFKREFGAESIWGVKFKRPAVGGDYDVITKLDGALVYVEVKSSPPKQVDAGEVTAFLDRVVDLAPEVAVFLMDTELRMKDKLVPMFETELQNRYKDPPKVVRMERELFHVLGTIFIVNAKESIVRNIGKIMRWHYQHRSALFSGNMSPEHFHPL